MNQPLQTQKSKGMLAEKDALYREKTTTQGSIDIDMQNPAMYMNSLYAGTTLMNNSTSNRWADQTESNVKVKQSSQGAVMTNIQVTQASNVDVGPEPGLDLAEGHELIGVIVPEDSEERLDKQPMTSNPPMTIVLPAERQQIKILNEQLPTSKDEATSNSLRNLDSIART